MRLRFPPIPFVVHVRVEYRPWTFVRPRFSVSALVIAVAALAVMIGAYATLVQIPEKRARYRKAEQAIEQQLALLNFAAEEARQADRETIELLERDRTSLEKEEQSASQYPASSEQHAYHEQLAALWRAQVIQISRSVGRQAEIADAFRSRSEEIRRARSRIINDLFAIERLAIEAEKPPDSPVWKRRGLEFTLAGLKPRMPVDPDLLEATAIWQATISLAELHPGVKPAGLSVKAKGRDFGWTVVFTDPKSKQNYPVNCYFSRSTVDGYQAQLSSRARSRWWADLWH